MNRALCFLIINKIDKLPRLAVESALSQTNAPIFIGYLNKGDLVELPTDSRISLIDLTKAARKLNLDTKTQSYVSFDNNYFFSLVQLKWMLFEQVLSEQGIDYLVYVDLDVVIIQDFLKEFDEAFIKNPSLKALVQHFTYSPSEPRLCMGIFALKGGAFADQLIKECQVMHSSGLKINPRLGDDDVITDFYLNLPDKSQIMLLPQQSFPVGNLINLFMPFAALRGLRPDFPFIFHANFVVGNLKKVLLLQLLLMRTNSIGFRPLIVAYGAVFFQSFKNLYFRALKKISK